MADWITARQLDGAFFALLREWCDALVDRQIDSPDAALRGGVLCPACGRIHGRCHEAVYPLLYTAKRTGEEKYLTAAKRLFAWGENMVCADGGMRNDAGSDWKGVTAFAAIALHDALRFHGDLLDAPEREKWTARLSDMGEWLHSNLIVGCSAYINYYAANACAMALLGSFFQKADYLSAARSLADYCFAHRSENDLLYGEGRPHDARTAKGCLAADHGYNVEESLPSLVRYAEAMRDTDAEAQCERLYRAELSWMLPDGAWDNSAGTRSFKWTYWGSRTADGCQDALLRLGRRDPVFAQAAWQNFLLLRLCTHDGLLAGGVDYVRAGEALCVHHTFCHAKTLAAALDAGVYDFAQTPLPALSLPPLRHYPELDTYRLACGDWIADVTGYDARYKRGGHVSGGALSLLWHRRCGAVCAAGMAEYSLFEPFNQQLPRDPATHRSPCPRIEAQIGETLYTSIADHGAVLRGETQNDRAAVCVRGRLCNTDNEPMPADGDCTLRYALRADGLRIDGSVCAPLARQARCVLPVASDAAVVSILRGSAAGQPQRIFNLTPGFLCREYVVVPDDTGRFSVAVTALSSPPRWDR